MKHVNLSITVFLLFCFFIRSLQAQNDPAWDDTKRGNWKPPFKKIEIPSSVDGKLQKAYLYATTSKVAKPLIVSLHTWSGDYSQKDPLITEILARDWNYIHPDFRGKNNHPEAVGSPLVAADIEDAIRYALEKTHANPDEVHIVGVSGGGYATLLAYMNVHYPVKSFSAWVPISDIDAWYWESVGRKQKYANDMLKAVSPKEPVINREEALLRSPLWQAYPRERRKDSKLFIYTGIHDGYKGSVPITHSLFMYNRLVGELKYKTTDWEEIMRKAATDTVLVAEGTMLSLVTKQTNPPETGKKDLYGRPVHLHRSYDNITLIVFEGGHEQLPQALALVPYEETTALKCNIVTIGDSNGHNKSSWVNELRSLLPQANIINNSQSGRTIGFDNNGREQLNALRNIDTYLDKAQKELKGEKLDYLILCLGTNDTKKDFSERQDEVPPNFKSLLEKIRKHPLVKKNRSRLVYLTPPPIRKKNIEEKYSGGNDRLAHLFPALKTTAEKAGFMVIDAFNPLQGVLDYYAADGVHMAEGGQRIVALRVVDELTNK